MTTFAELGIERLEVLEFRPDDVLIVTVPNDTSADQAAVIKATLTAVLHGRPCLVKTADAVISAAHEVTA